MPEISLTDETWARLKSRAEPFEDTPESVIRRLLDATDTQELREGSAMYSVGAHALDEQPPSPVTAISRSNTPSIARLSAPEKRRLPRLGHGIKVPQIEFRNPILLVLQEMGGSGQTQEVLEGVERRMHNRLTSVDYALIPSGHEARWRKSANWERMNMVNDGLLQNDSPRGIWKLSDKGWAEARKLNQRHDG